MRTLVLILDLALLGVAACQSPLTCDNGYAVSTSARSGCRSPVEIGCTMCCIGITDGSCAQYMRTPDNMNPWYNAVQVIRPSCPSDCRPCAQCSVDAEKNLCQLLSMPRDCDCAHIQIRNDPCIEPMSCDCYCQTYKGLTTACPNQ